ncbi:lactoylglutathione lyase [Candidatus Methylacidiphilum fumarolicum]|uniref:Lactoylglutathione lyase or related enzyme n=2 Tax=Candidatus Methylacidiphilum fumarolicum TaxID=591154 RepID=I0JY56_METFB|nr:VOC family protein [Candidatus Methylacidiphilum fumarolicum]MBW6415225.1 VOC family protein [Candidatus Methylacidiphilum fumarolicum]TFE69810.1 lactoylglutathione lyase [Candidatus Methylacidiphilum fumarolicum]TFE71677.1 lactoylglutathione lyase [Candidatus Methylacidiphilum fumarolicum]TFE72617.1 lactoylglutathione lyase [Candidatus Methylacidiphilum fumarolicum]TFE76710.1 lactoylglutathione lyase [Candidatus Methylacidiphilum fumarolicum]
MVVMEAIHHVTLPVKDLERSIRFYTEVLGLKQIVRPPFSFPGAWFEVGNQQLHLTVVSSPIPNTESRWIDTKARHVAFRVKNITEALTWLKGKGYSEEQTDPAFRLKINLNSVAGFPQIFLLDPDGHLLEINSESSH